MPKPRRQYHHGNLRRALLDEALATIRREGIEGVTLRDIGARLGVSRTALYRHFADKRALLEGVAIEGFRALREALVAAWRGGGEARAGFRAMGRAYVRFAVDNSAHYRVMFGGFFAPDCDHDPALDAEGAGAFQALVDALAALQAEGLVRDDDVELMASHVWALVHGIAMLAIDGQVSGEGAVEALTRYALDRLRTGIGAPADQPAASSKR
jgi:AcrR family transcriptional regulator